MDSIHSTSYLSQSLPIFYMPVRQHQNTQKPDYDPLPEPQIRKRFLRDELRGKRTRGSHADSKKLAAQMVAFKPLTPLNSTELSLLKQYLAENFDWMQGHMTRSIDAFRADGEGDKQVGDRLSNLKKWRESTRHTETFGRATFTEDISLSHWSSGSGLAKPLAGWLDETFALKPNGPIDFLDVGAGECQFAEKVKLDLGERAMVQATTLDSSPHGKVDKVHLLTGEYYPQEFDQKFDVITSQKAFEFSLFPHLFLENIAKSLKPSGKAGIYAPMSSGFDSFSEPFQEKAAKYYALKSPDEMSYEALDRMEKKRGISTRFQTSLDGYQPHGTLKNADRKNPLGCIFMERAL